MIPSKFNLSEDLSSQKSTQGKILEWMQAHPKQCKRTNATMLAKQMNTDHVGRTDNIRQVICRMVNNQILSRHGNRRHASFRINYLHKDIPPYILEGAPSDDKKTRKMVEEGLKDNQRLDDVGCIVTEPEPKESKDEPWEKFVETLQDKEKLKVEPKEKEESSPNQDDEEYPELDQIIEQLTVPVMVNRKKENGSTNISITLNLNLNN